MACKDIIYLTFSDILAVIKEVERLDALLPVPDLDGPIAIIRPDAIVSILDKARNGIVFVPDLFDSATIYLRDISREHYLTNGNKRTALLSTSLFLNNNGLALDVKEPEAAEFVQMEVVVNNMEHDDVKEWIKKHVKNLPKKS